jgi:hypothetical protein
MWAFSSSQVTVYAIQPKGGLYSFNLLNGSEGWARSSTVDTSSKADILSVVSALCRRSGEEVAAETRVALAESVKRMACGLEWGSTSVTADGAKDPK